MVDELEKWMVSKTMKQTSQISRYTCDRAHVNWCISLWLSCQPTVAKHLAEFWQNLLDALKSSSIFLTSNILRNIAVLARFLHREWNLTSFQIPCGANRTDKSLHSNLLCEICHSPFTREWTNHVINQTQNVMNSNAKCIDSLRA